MTNPGALEAWNDTVAAFLAHGASTPDHLDATLEAEPGFALGHAAKGLLHLLLSRRELLPVADRALDAARKAVAGGGADMREREYVAALETLRAGRMWRAADRMDAIAARWPGDSLATKLAQAIRFQLGDARGMRVSIAAAAPGFGMDHPHLGYVMGCRAFALEENGLYDEAEKSGRAGLELAQNDAWGLHAVAHVMDMTGRPGDGIGLLAGNPARWAHCSNFGYHVWWHLALFHIERGDFPPALDLYDRRVRCDKTDDYRDISNGAALLTRLEIEGVDVGDRWEELADLSANRVDDGQLIFADLHYILSLVRGGRQAEADALSARIAADAQNMDHDQHEIGAVAGAPAARGLAAFRAGHYAQAHAGLAAAMPELNRIGGSHAQRDVFERLCVEAAMRAGLLDAAERALADRARRRGAHDGYEDRRRAAIAARRAGDLNLAVGSAVH